MGEGGREETNSLRTSKEKSVSKSGGPAFVKKFRDAKHPREGRKKDHAASAATAGSWVSPDKRHREKK